MWQARSFYILSRILECFKNRSAVHFYTGVQCVSVRVRVSTCTFVYIHSKCVFASHFSETDRGKVVRWRDISSAQREVHSGACLQLFWSGRLCIRRRRRMCQRVLFTSLSCLCKSCLHWTRWWRKLHSCRRYTVEHRCGIPVVPLGFDWSDLTVIQMSFRAASARSKHRTTSDLCLWGSSLSQYCSSSASNEPEGPCWLKWLRHCPCLNDDWLI